MKYLSSIYGKDSDNITLAECPNCGERYVDDLPNYGSILSPCCPGACLVRGIESEPETRIKIENIVYTTQTVA